MLLEVLYLAIGIVGLYFGAEWLVSGSAKLALRWGVTPLVIGLTVVAFGTSAPELFVSLGLNYDNKPNAAVGNVIGSNICNIFFILGVSALIQPIAIQSQVIRREMPVLIAVSLMLVLMLADGQLQRWEGVILTLGIIAYVWLSFALTSKMSSPDEIVAEDVESLQDADAMSPAKLSMLVFAGLLLLVAGAWAFKTGGIGIAQKLGVSEALIALTVLALGTSLPELATSVVASLKGEGDIIAGNAVGSSVFNIMAVLGITVLLKPMLISEIVPMDLWVMVGSAIIAVALMLTLKNLTRTAGALMVVAYLVYIVVRVTMFSDPV